MPRPCETDHPDPKNGLASGCNICRLFLSRSDYRELWEKGPPPTRVLPDPFILEAQKPYWAMAGHRRVLRQSPLGYPIEEGGAAQCNVGLTVWPAGVLMAELLHHLVRQGETVNEIGPGTGVSCIAASLKGADVAVSEIIPVTMMRLEQNYQLNGLSPPRTILHGNPCFSVISDVSYNRSGIDACIRALSPFQSPRVSFIMVDSFRPNLDPLIPELLQAGDLGGVRSEYGIFEAATLECFSAEWIAPNQKRMRFRFFVRGKHIPDSVCAKSRLTLSPVLSRFLPC